jgi:hypothetical protein
MFDRAFQDQFAMDKIESRVKDVGGWNKASSRDIANSLAAEWAAFQQSNGAGRYEKVGLNGKAYVGFNDVVSAVDEARANRSYGLVVDSLNPYRAMSVTDVDEVGGDYAGTGGGLSAIGDRAREYAMPASRMDVYEAPSGWSQPKAESNFGQNFGNAAVGGLAKAGIGAVGGLPGMAVDFGIGAITGRSASGRIADAMVGPRQQGVSPYTDYSLALDPFTPPNTPLSRAPDQAGYSPTQIPGYQAPNPDISGSRIIDDARRQFDDGTYSSPMYFGDPAMGISQFVNAPSAEEWARVSGLSREYGTNSLAAGAYEGMRTGNSNEGVGVNPVAASPTTSSSGSSGGITSTTAPAPIAIAGGNVKNRPVFPDREVPEPYRSMLIQSGYGLDGLGGWNFFPDSGKARQAMATGGLVQGRGTETSDSVPAIIDGETPAALSAGEFVFTGAAVRGIGGGDRMEGARRLHAMMKKAERMGGK